MNESILNSIKKLLGLSALYEAFDQDIIIHINSVFAILTQLGVGPSSGFKIESEEETWADFIDETYNMEDVKTYIYLKVRLVFDPPLNSSVLQAQKDVISELEWRLNIECDESNNIK